MQGFIIAGTNSGCGKTTVSIGLMALLKSLGKNIAPYKTGPDYIDPLFHSKILGTPSYNLDSYLLSESAITYLFQKHSFNKDISIVEGVMGMYDGMGVNALGSTHELSRKLNLPVVLVVNCKGLYQSVAAIVKGFVTLQPDAKVKGVVFNQCPGRDYYTFLKQMVEQECGVKCVGYVPTNAAYTLEGRHLGLVQAEEVDALTNKVSLLSDTLKETIDVEALLKISRVSKPKPASFQLPDINLNGLKIGIAHDKAFRFYYQDNLELLEELGAELLFFSPLNDDAMTTECNCLYLGGGYPEVFAKELSSNTKLLQEIKDKVEEGMPVYAECGGLMYLADKIVGLNNERYSMAGVFQTSVQMTKRLQKFGYAKLKYKNETIKCHEFHHSKIVEEGYKPNYTLAYHLSKPERKMKWQCGLTYKNCLAGYAHLHFYANFQFFKNIVDLWKKAIT